MTQSLLGLPLSEALERLGGGDWTVRETCPPRGKKRGELRVIQVRDHELVVSRFETRPDMTGEDPSNHAQVP